MVANTDWDNDIEKVAQKRNTRFRNLIHLPTDPLYKL